MGSSCSGSFSGARSSVGPGVRTTGSFSSDWILQQLVELGIESVRVDLRRLHGGRTVALPYQASKHTARGATIDRNERRFDGIVKVA
jgi:hypothetical protein